MHPADATDRGLAEGDQALVANETGRLVMRVTLTETLPLGVALSYKGRWPKQEAGQRNVNVLNPGASRTWGKAPACTAWRLR
jgi:anaerobic selenocysteine-containing dehydrogenase